MVEPMYIVGIDPSGDISGKKKGKTGMCILKLDEDNNIRLLETCIFDNSEYKDYIDMISHIDDKLQRVNEIYATQPWGSNIHFAIEDFVLDPIRAKYLAYDKLETSKLIGSLLVLIDQEYQSKVSLQRNLVKKDYPEDRLVKEGVIQKVPNIKVNKYFYHDLSEVKHSINGHERDSIKHAYSCARKLIKERKGK